MEIKNVNVYGQANFTDRLNNAVYNEGIGISKDRFNELLASIKSFSNEKINQLEGDLMKATQVHAEEEKNTICDSIKGFLVENGVPIAHSLTATGIFEIAKMLCAS